MVWDASSSLLLLLPVHAPGVHSERKTKRAAVQQSQREKGDSDTGQGQGVS